MPGCPRVSVQPNPNTNRSNSSRCCAYRRLNGCSIVDESLFGEPERLKAIRALDRRKIYNRRDSDVKINVYCNRQKLPECPLEIIHGKPNKKLLNEPDRPREIILKNNKVYEKTIYLSKAEMDRIRNRARVMTEDEIKEMEEKEKALKDKLLMESNIRKDQMKNYDKERRANEKLNDLEEEARQKAQYLLSKAMEQREDEEEEIKQLNTAITNAKIQAIRDAQVLEKQQIKKELAEENDRLDRMMEIDRQNALQVQAAIDARRKEEEMLGACEIIKQINQNEQERLLKLEKMEQENIVTRKRIASEMMEEMSRRIDRKTKQEQLREELDKCSQLMRESKLKKAEEDRLLDLKIMHEQREKAEREAAFEEEQRRIRAEKEKEANRLRGLQERAIDLQAEKDELRAKRAMEESERQWRRKQLAAARKAKETQEEMQRERVRAEEHRTRLLAMEATRNKMEFERILQLQKEAIEKEKLEEEKRRKLKIEFSNDLKKQICEKEQQRIAERNAFFEEGVRMEEEARLRRLRLEEAKNRKMEELRKAGIPEKYLAEIERKAGQLNISSVGASSKTK